MRRVVAASAVIALVVITIAAARPAADTYENARAVGKRCSTCHVGKHPAMANLNERGKYFLTHRTLDGYTPGATRRPVSPAAPGAARGAAIFARTCAPCHGLHGEGAPPGKPLVGAARKRVTRAAIEDVVRHGVKGTAMAPFGGVLTDQEITDVVQHVLSLSARR